MSSRLPINKDTLDADSHYVDIGSTTHALTGVDVNDQKAVLKFIASKLQTNEQDYDISVNEDGSMIYTAKNAGVPNSGSAPTATPTGSPYNSNYGVRRMQLALAQSIVFCGLRRLTRLMQDIHADRTWRKTDISQIQCTNGKLYISPIMDCFNGEILSLCMYDKAELCVNTLKAASRST